MKGQEAHPNLELHAVFRIGVMRNSFSDKVCTNGGTIVGRETSTRVLRLDGIVSLAVCSDTRVSYTLVLSEVCS